MEHKVINKEYANILILGPAKSGKTSFVNEILQDYIDKHIKVKTDSVLISPLPLVAGAVYLFSKSQINICTKQLLERNNINYKYFHSIKEEKLENIFANFELNNDFELNVIVLYVNIEALP